MGSKPPPPVPRTHGGPTHVVGVPHAQTGGVRTLIIRALRHIRSPLDLQHGPRGSKIEKRRQSTQISIPQ